MDNRALILSVLIVVCVILAASLIIMLVLIFAANYSDRNMRKGMGLSYGEWLDDIAYLYGLHRRPLESDSALAFRALNVADTESF